MKTILALLLLLTALPASALDLTALRDQTRELTLDTGTRLRFSTTTIDRYLNEAQRIAVTDTKSIRKSIHYESTVGTTYYTMPSDYWQVQRVTYEDIEITEQTPIALSLKAGLKWETVQARPTNFYINLSSRTLLGLYPVPGSTSSTGTIKIEYYSLPTDMTAITDTPFDGIQELTSFHYALPYYAAYRLCAIDGRLDLMSLYRMEFYEGVQRMRREANNRPSYRPGMQPRTRSNRVGP